MKKVLMFIQASCPHCKRALSYAEELFAEQPEYRALDIEICDENRDPKRAGSFDYWYVPTYYVDGVKAYEGAMSKNDVKAVFDAALER